MEWNGKGAARPPYVPSVNGALASAPGARAFRGRPASSRHRYVRAAVKAEDERCFRKPLVNVKERAHIASRSSLRARVRFGSALGHSSRKESRLAPGLLRRFHSDNHDRPITST